MLLLAGVALLYAGKDVGVAFDMVTTVSAVCFMFVWSIILASYLAFRKRRPELHGASPLKMPGGIPMVWVVFAFFAFLIWALTTQPDTLTALLVTPAWFAVLGGAHAAVRRTPLHGGRGPFRGKVALRSVTVRRPRHLEERGHRLPARHGNANRLQPEARPRNLRSSGSTSAPSS
ncbi:amino acid transporter [Arthrobacter sp. UYCu723]